MKGFDNFTVIGQAINRFFDVIAPFLAGTLLAYLLYIPASRIEKNFQKAKYIKDSIIIICMTLFLNMFLYLIFE